MTGHPFEKFRVLMMTNGQIDRVRNFVIHGNWEEWEELRRDVGALYYRCLGLEIQLISARARSESNESKEREQRAKEAVE